MRGKSDLLSHGEKLRIVEALETIRKQVSWKPSKNVEHLNKRKRMRHLATSASMQDYDRIILDIVKDIRNVIYLYEFRGVHYYAVRGYFADREWLILFGAGGLMETAFPPQDMDEYLERRGFVLLGRIEEVLGWTQEAGI